MTDEQQRTDIEAMIYDRIVDLRDLDQWDLSELPDDELAPAIVIYNGTAALVLLPERVGTSGVHLSVHAYSGGCEIEGVDISVLPDNQEHV